MYAQGSCTFLSMHEPRTQPQGPQSTSPQTHGRRGWTGPHFPVVPQRPCRALYFLFTLGRGTWCPWCPVDYFFLSAHPGCLSPLVSSPCPLQLVCFCSMSLSLSLSFLDLAADGAGRGGADAATPLSQLRCGAPASQCRGRVPVRRAPQSVHCPRTLRQQPHMCRHTHIQSQTHCTTVCTQTQTVTRSSSWMLPWSHGHRVTASHPCSSLLCTHMPGYAGSPAVTGDRQHPTEPHDSQTQSRLSCE